MAITTSDGQVVVDLVLDARGVADGVRLATGETRKLEAQAGTTGRVFDVALGNVDARAAERLLVSLGRLGPAAYEIALAADDVEEAYRDTFNGASAELDRFLKDWGNSVGETDAFAQEIGFNIAQIGQGFGMTVNESEGFMRRILVLARDLTSRTGKPIEQSIQSLRGLVVGNMESLREQFGISVSAADTTRRALEMTGKASEKALTQEERAVAALDLAYERAGKTVGDYERTQDSAANSSRRSLGILKQNALDLARSFMPIFEDLTAIASGFLEDNQEAIAAAIDRVGVYARAVFQFGKEYAETLGQIARFLWEHKELVGGLVAAWGLYKTAVNSARIAQALLNAIMAANPIGLVVAGLAIAIGLWVKFKDRVYDAGAAIAEWGAKAVRTFGQVSTTLAGVAAGLSASNPAMAGARDFFARVAGGSESAAERLDDLAASSRRSAEEVRDGRREMEEANMAAEAYAGGLEDVEDRTNRVGDSSRKTKSAIAQLRTTVRDLRRELDELLSTDPKTLGGLLFEEENLRGRMRDVEQYARVVAAFGETLAKLQDVAARPLPPGLEADQISRAISQGRAVTGDRSPQARALISDEELEAIARSAARFEGQYEQIMDRFRRHTKKAFDDVEERFARLDDAIERSLEDAAVVLATGLGEMLAGTAGADEVAQRLLLVFADMLDRLGRIALATAIGIEGIRKALESLNPVAAAAAGAALIALAAVIRGQVARLADDFGGRGSGGSGGSGRRFAGDPGPSGGKGMRGALAGRRAAGGPVDAGRPYLVGERGPEVVVPGAPGHVVSNAALVRALGFAAGGAAQGWHAMGQPSAPVIHVEAPPLPEPRVIMTPEGLVLAYRQGAARLNQTRGTR